MYRQGCAPILRQGRSCPAARRSATRKPHRAQEGILPGGAEQRQDLRVFLPTQWITLIPTVYNADTLGIVRPDLHQAGRSKAGRSCSTREFKGQGVDPQHPLDRHPLDAAHGWWKAMKRAQIRRQGRQPEPRPSSMPHHEGDEPRPRRPGQFRAFWKDFNESVNLMASGEVGDPVEWSPAVARYARRASPAPATRSEVLAPGRRVSGCRARCRACKADLACREFINWLPGRLGRSLSRLAEGSLLSAVLENR